MKPDLENTENWTEELRQFATINSNGREDKKMKQTKGPWKINGDNAVVLGGDGFIVADCTRAKNLKVYSGKDDGNDKANAHLIASAPDLLEACKCGLKKLENMTTEEFSCGFDKPIRESLEQAISKAEGK